MGNRECESIVRLRAEVDTEEVILFIGLVGDRDRCLI